MSLKLLIADDEYFIRQRIKKIIPWEKLNLTFAGEAENGQQVIDHLEKEPVDLLLLDIKMPQMNGIETARYIKEHFPSVHMLILSGYNDFEYARTAIRYGVKEYLLKPVAAEEQILVAALEIQVFIGIFRARRSAQLLGFDDRDVFVAAGA